MTDSEHNARKYSFKLLSYRGRSSRELKERLSKKGFSDTAINNVLRDLQDKGYIDDKVLAEQVKRQALNNKCLGYNSARQFMMKRGLSAETVDATLSYNDDMELRNALRLIEKKTKVQGNSLSMKEKRRLWNFLLRKGFSFSTMKMAFKNYNLNREDEL